MISFDQNFWLTLVPFIALVFNCFNNSTAADSSLWSALVKILPIVWLIFCAKYANQLIASNNSGVNRVVYTNYVFYGLLAAMVGDICLVWPQNNHCLTLGILAFSFTHYFYAKALGFTPIKLRILLIYCLPIATINLFLIYDRLQGAFVIIVPVYSLLIITVFWRALVSYNLKPSQSSSYSLVGAILFMISDGILGVELFSYPDLFSAQIFRYFVLITYYFSQLLFVLSINANNRVLIGRRISHRYLKKNKS